MAKAIVNSPLVKTAVHGADPNWGRVAMAIGKCEDDTDIDPERVVIRFGDLETYPDIPDEDGLERLRRVMAADHVDIEVDSWHSRARSPSTAATCPTATCASTPTTRPKGNREGSTAVKAM